MKFWVDSARRLDGDVARGLSQTTGQGADLALQQGLAARDHHVSYSRFHRLVNQTPDRPPFTLRQPRSVGRVAPPAAQVATRGADEEGRHPGEDAFALEAGESLCDVHIADKVAF